MNFSGGLFCWKKQSQKIRPKNSGPKFGRPKFVSQNSGQNSGSGGAKSPVQTFVPEKVANKQNYKQTGVSEGRTGKLMAEGCETSKLLVAIFDLQLPSPRSSLKMPSELHLDPCWEFRPRKKYLAPPPPIPANTLPAARPPAPHPPGRPPPLLGFSIKSLPPPSWCLGLLLPLPRAEKNKKYPKRPPRTPRVKTWLGCYFAPPSGRNLQGHFQVNFSQRSSLTPHSFLLEALVNFSRVSVDFQQFTVSFSQSI